MDTPVTGTADPHETAPWRTRLVSAALVLGIAAALVLVASLINAIDARPPVNRFGTALQRYDVTDRIRLWALGVVGTPTVLALLAVVAATVASPKRGPDRPPMTVAALAIAGGCALVFTAVLAYELAVGPSDAGRTLQHAFSRLASILMGGAAVWWSALALKPDEPERRGPPVPYEPPPAPTE